MFNSNLLSLYIINLICDTTIQKPLEAGSVFPLPGLGPDQARVRGGGGEEPGPAAGAAQGAREVRGHCPEQRGGRPQAACL